jgi:ABC-2 type transport system permease protein
MGFAFPYLLLPLYWTSRNRLRRLEAGDGTRAAVFGSMALGVFVVIFAIVFWLTWQLLDYEELGEYLVRLGLSWLLLTFLSFLAFSSLVISLSTFFLSEDLWLLLAAPASVKTLFYSRFVKAAGQSSWMVVAFLAPVLLGVGMARCATWLYYVQIVITLIPFALIPVALGSIVTLLLVNTFPARRARDVLVLLGLVFAIALVVMLRFLRPERLLNIQSLPDVTAFFATLQTPITPLLPSFWASEALFSALRGFTDWFHLGCLWSTALAATVVARLAYERAYLNGWSKAQEARKARFSRLRWFGSLVERLPLGTARRSLLLKDAKVFLRDTTQWSQLLLLLALISVYLYNFQVLDLDRMPYIGRMIKNAYAFVNLAMAAFVLSAISVRFVFPAVSAEGPAFWIVRSSPVPMRDFLWSKFWTGLVPVLLLAEALTIISNQFLGVDVFLQVLGAVAIFAMSFALVGLGIGLGAQHPRFNAENLTQVAGSYGGVAYMIQAALFIVAEIILLAYPTSMYLWYDYRSLPLAPSRMILMGASFTLAFAICVVVFWAPMQRGVRALEEMES